MNGNDLLTRLDAMSSSLQTMQEAQALALAEERERLLGIKKIRLPLMFGLKVGSALLMGGDTSVVPQMPDQGYVWSLRDLVIEGLTASATAPDVVNILWRGRIQWQLNGNQFAQTWGRGEKVIWPGESITYQSVGTFASTATIVAHGTVDEVPGEKMGRFL